MSLVGALALLVGCGGAQGGGAGGKLTVLMKDAPAALQAAVVTIAEVDLVGSSGTLVLSTTRTTTDLLTLANDTARLVDGAVVPAGTYTQLRFVITGGYVQVDGRIYASSPTYEGLPPGAAVAGPLRMPSYAQSGLKIDLPDGALTIASDEKIVLVDFDVAQSFGHEAGSSGAWVMHPVCKATDIEVTGSLHVTLALAPEVSLPEATALADFDAVLTPAGGGDGVKVPLGDEGNGTFGVVFRYLAPGEYLISFEPPATIASFTTDPVTPASAAVSSAQETTASFLLRGATASPPPTP
jgi:hypothetical protein